MKTKAIKWVVFALLIALWHPAMSQYFKKVGLYREGMAVVQKVVPGIWEVGYYGYVNEYDKLVIPMKYTYACDFHDGLAIVGIGAKEGLINKAGRVVYPIVCDRIEMYDPSNANWSFDFTTLKRIYVIEVDGFRGVLDRNGKVLVPCKYWIIHTEKKDFGYCFSVTRPDNYTELYDVHGKALLPSGYAIPYKYDKTITKTHDNWNVSSGSSCVIAKDGKYGAFDLVKGRKVLETEYDWVDIHGKYFITVKNGLYGLADADGSIIYPNLYSRVSFPGDFLCIFNEKEEFGVYDLGKHEVVLPVECKEIGDYAIACKNKYHFWGTKTRYEYDDCWYDTIIPISVNLMRSSKREFILKRSGKYGMKVLKAKEYKEYMDTLKEVLPFEYDVMEYEEDFPVSWQRSIDGWSGKPEKISVIHYRKDGKWGMFTDNVPTRTVSDAKMQESGHFMIAQNNGKYGFYVSEGDIQFKYDKIPVAISQDIWLVENKDKYGVVRYCWQSDGGPSAAGDYVGIKKNISGWFTECLSPIYDTIRVFERGIALTEKDGKNGYVRLNCSQEGQKPIELPYQKAEYGGIYKVVSKNDKHTGGEKKDVWAPVFSVMKNRKWGLIGVDGNNVMVIARPQYDSISPFIREEAFVTEGRRGYKINVSGKRISKKQVFEDGKWQPLQHNVMLMGNYSLSNTEQHSFGLTIAYAERFGIYASIAGSHLLLLPELTISPEQQQDYLWNGETSSSRFFVTAGGMCALSKFGYVYAGAGYSQRNLLWETMSGRLLAISPDSFKGVAVETGLLFNLKGFLISAGGLKQINNPYYEIKFGIGVNIKTQ